MSNIYWQRRVNRRLEAQASEDLKEVEKKLAQLYKVEQADLKRQILEVYAKMEQDKLLNGKPYENDYFRTDRLWTLYMDFQEKLRKLGHDTDYIMEDHLIRTYIEAQRIVREGVPKTLVKSSYVPLAVEPKHLIHSVWCPDGKDFSDRIWKDKENMLPVLRRSLADSIAQGKTAWDTALAIEGKLDVSLSNAMRLARTETTHASIIGQVDKYKEYGITHAIYYGTGCCEDCQELNGQKFPLEQIKTLIPHHPNCTCSFLLDL